MSDQNFIDFSALETELQASIESDMKYWRENDAKIRAVEQRVSTYDEFRSIILFCSLHYAKSSLT